MNSVLLKYMREKRKWNNSLFVLSDDLESHSVEPLRIDTIALN